MPEPFDPLEDEYPYEEEEENLQEEYDAGLCEDESCDTCYPINTPFVAPESVITGEWSDSAGPVNDSLREGAIEVPENTPEVVINRPVINPNIRGVMFSTRGGGAVRTEGTIDAGYTAQISFWDMTPTEVRNSYREFREWCVDNQFGFTQMSSDYFNDSGFQVNVQYYFTLCNPDNRSFIDPNTVIHQPLCSCGGEPEYPSTMCPSCHEPLYCQTCRAFSTGVRQDLQYGISCDNCCRTCATCDAQFHSNHGQCPDCNPSVRCVGCSERMYEGRDSINEHVYDDDGDIGHYCDICFESLCYSCGEIVGLDHILQDEGHNCVNCVQRNSHEEWDENSNDDVPRILTIPGRETIRLVGLEIEGANGEGLGGMEGGNLLANELYQQGLSGNHSMSGYHSSDGRRMTVHVERDSSVDWELVIGPMNVADDTHVQTMNRSVRIVRAFINDGTLKLDMRAGMHVHVGADRVPFHNAYNLHKLYMYMEDFLYRIGAAKWPYHRSVNRRGRDQAGKSPNTEGKLNFARTFAGQRYYGLSFDNYFARYFDQCNCGARNYGLFDECECDLGKCTFEFRLFNTTANTVKIHAYLAICQALVAKAIDMDEITNQEDYPALDFIKSRVSDMTPSVRTKMVREWEKRIVFVNEEMPLTPEEKKSLHYCIMNSEVGKVVTNADILLETEDN